MKRLFITGASGFIGKNLKEILLSQYKLFTPSHSQLDLLDGKRVKRYLKEKQIDIIVHTAYIGGVRGCADKQIIYPNLKMFINLARCESCFKKMIFLGSGAEYDKKRNLHKVKESDFGKSVPGDKYGFSKFICSYLVENSEKVIHLRLFGVYGKYEDYRIRFISNAICKMLFDLPITINQNVFFDYLYIKDLVGIIDYFIQHKNKNKFYNIGLYYKTYFYSYAE